VIEPAHRDHVPSRRSFLHAVGDRSHLYSLLNRGLGAALAPWIEKGDKPSRTTPPELYLCNLEISPTVEAMFGTMKALLGQIAQYAESRSVPLAFALAPSMLQVDDARWASLLRRYGRKAEDYDQSLPNRTLLEFAAANDIPMVDFLPAMRAEAAKGRPLYNPIEQHWNLHGNRVAASTLHAFLRESSLLSREPDLH
jgi:hypothetical protein